MLFTNLKISPTREGAAGDVNRGAIFEEKVLHSAEKDVGPDHKALLLLWVWPATQTDPIFSCFVASSSNTNARKQLFWNVQTQWLGLAFARVFTLRIKAKSASIDVTKGVGGVNPQTTLTIL